MGKTEVATQTDAVVLFAADELGEGESRIVEVEGKQIGVFNVKGTFKAYLNVCPHQKAPVCLGPVSGTNVPSDPGEYDYSLEGQVLKCPWHGWEFDLNTGSPLFNREKGRLAAYEVWVQDGNVVTSLQRVKQRRNQDLD